MKSLKEIMQESLDVQNACNLCGVAQGFARIMRELSDHCPTGTNERNTHEIATLWLDKMLSLNNYTDEKANKAFQNAFTLTEGK